MSADANKIDSTTLDGQKATFARVDPTTKLPTFELAAGHFDEALALYRALLQSDPKNHDADASTLTALGLESWQNGDGTGALEAYRMIAALYPDSMDAHDTLAWTYASTNDSANAAREYEECIATFARDTKAPASDKEWMRKHALWELRRLRREPSSSNH
jgi:tetratricopeptide (TPR) repeat protein